MAFLTTDEIMNRAKAKWDDCDINTLMKIVIQITADQCQDVACLYDNANTISDKIAQLYIYDDY